MVTADGSRFEDARTSFSWASYTIAEGRTSSVLCSSFMYKLCTTSYVRRYAAVKLIAHSSSMQKMIKVGPDHIYGEF